MSEGPSASSPPGSRPGEPATRRPRPPGSGLEPNVAAALSYLLGAVTGLVFLLREKDRPFVRFHALQSIAVTVVFVAAYAAVSVLTLVLPVVPGLGAPLAVLLGLALSLAGVALWLCLMFQAFQGREWEVPGLGARVRAFVVPAAGGDGRGGPSA